MKKIGNYIKEHGAWFFMGFSNDAVEHFKTLQECREYWADYYGVIVEDIHCQYASGKRIPYYDGESDWTTECTAIDIPGAAQASLWSSTWARLRRDI